MLVHKQQEWHAATLVMHVSLLLLALAVSAKGNGPWLHSTELNKGNYKLEWTVPDKNDRIQIRITAKTQGWIGFGLSPNGGMAGADIVIAGVEDDTGEGYVYDRYANSNSFPQLDDHQDYELIEAKQEGEYTTVTLERNIKTCDAQDLDITTETAKIIWAVNPNDAASQDKFDQHTERGTRSLILIGGYPSRPVKLDDDDIFHIDMRLTDVAIPEDYDTHYECKLFELPDYVKVKKHHMIRAEFLIDAPEFVHHIVLHHCPYHIDMENNTQEYCMSGEHLTEAANENSPMRACTLRYAVGWAVGQETFFDFPEDTGYPVGGKETSQFMIEVHYDNSLFRKGISRDNSGFRMWLTPTPRKIDYATLTLGLPVSSYSVLIPPGQEEFTMHSFCNGECMQRLPAEGVNIHSAFLHQHLAGKAMRLRHIRDGVEQAPLFQDMKYDFNYQNGHVLSKTVKLYPDDTLLFDCTFQTRDRNTVTTTGFSTTEEMCFAFVGYYPRVESLVSCSSGPEMSTYAAALGIKQIGKSGNFSNGNAGKTTLKKYLNTIDFGRVPDGVAQTPIAAKFEKHVREGKQEMACVSSDVVNDKVYQVFEDRDIPFPSKKNEYKPPNEC